MKRKATIDVKGLKNKTNWPMPKKPLVHKDHFYVLVSFLKHYKNLNVMPEAFVIPSRSVRRIWVLWSGHKTQRGISYGKANTKRYKSRWDLLFEENILN